MMRMLTAVLGCLAVAGASTSCSDDSGPSPVPAAIIITPGDTILPQGVSAAFHATLVDSAGQTIPGAHFTWSSDDTTIVTVSAAGVVTAKRIGLADVYAANDTLSMHASIQVIDSLITTRLWLGTSAAGLAVAGGKAYVTLVDAESVAVLDIPGESETGRMASGFVPTGVTFNPTATRAYVTNQGGVALGFRRGHERQPEHRPDPGGCVCRPHVR